MTHQTSRQIALMTMLTTCILIVVVMLALGFDGDTRAAMAQASPLAIVLAAAFTFLMADRSPSR